MRTAITPSKYILSILFFIVSFYSFGQRKTTTVKSYVKKDGTFVRSHTRHYNSSNNSTSGDYAYNSSAYGSDQPEIVESTLAVVSTSSKTKLKKISGVKVIPTTLVADTNGVTILVAVLRYNDTSVIDICPLARSILTYDYESSSALYFKIPKDKLSPEHIIELVSKYNFELKDDFLMKYEYLGIGKIDLPKYLSLKIEAITLK